MKVAVIGANGQLGTDLVEVFGEEAIPLTHKDLDVTDFESLRILKELKPDVIINTATYVRVDDAELYPEKAFQVNAIGALNVAKIANEIDAVNVYISTDYVFDGTKGEPYTEEDAPNPLNVYGLSKYAGEIFTRNYSRKYYIIRVASLYGKAGASGKGGNFVEWVIEKAKRGEELKIVDDQFMSPTYTKDVARTLKKFLELKPEFGVYHMANEGYCSWYEFTRVIFEILGWDVEVKPIKSSELKRLAKRPQFSALKNEKLEKLGLKMRHWREALRDYLKEKGYIQ
ncbi:dTDP-4-dehydrorhamnose reductase [Thermococcus sp. M39]|uniref:dTDP-4-dehydrorhamnose reductase n=1 Tax=Thermococcus sp. M39 TaxID=1638262 RepID=UPI00143BEC71|nr:dTDP-4-dehydrorhamnose reductase [Thermococcus sp. M39]NJE09267.1 dTDP-4-dehydrorhamnose reductase [Thermococcus sp. M39]